METLILLLVVVRVITYMVMAIFVLVMLLVLNLAHRLKKLTILLPLDTVKVLMERQKEMELRLLLGL